MSATARPARRCRTRPSESWPATPSRDHVPTPLGLLLPDDVDDLVPDCHCCRCCPVSSSDLPLGRRRGDVEDVGANRGEAEGDTSTERREERVADVSPPRFCHLSSRTWASFARVAPEMVRPCERRKSCRAKSR